MLLYDYDKVFWIILIFSLVFFILSVISLFHNVNSSLFLLAVLWFLSFILIFLIGYSALLAHYHCRTFVFIIYLICLIFLTTWSMQLHDLMYANISIILILITGITVIYFTKPQYLPLGLIFVLIWLFIFFYMNQQ